MNRQQRRHPSKESRVEEAKSYLNSPCTISEAVQIARGVAEDVIADFNKHQATVQVAMSLQIEILKETVIGKGLITEEEFREAYMKKFEEFNKMRREASGEEIPETVEESPEMKTSVNSVDVEILK